jgi:sec-independent protein translocase protein TatA
MFAGGVGFTELIVIFLVILLLFGPQALSEIARGLAQAVKILKKEVREIKAGFDSDSAPRPADGKPERPKDVSGDFDPNLERRDWRPKKNEPGEENEPS